MRLAIAALWLCACQFDPSTLYNSGTDDNDDDVNRPDARSFPDAEPPADALTMCTANEKLCVDGVLETCLADGSGLDPAMAEICDFACVDNDRCVSASNLSAAQIAQCDGQYLPLAPGAGATLLIADSGGTPEIQCTPDCGDGVTAAIAGQAPITQASGPPLAFFCLSLLDLPAGATVNVQPNLPWAVALVVDGAASVAGTINVGGGDGSSSTAGASGPGGGAGGPLHNAQNQPGQGACPGQGGERGGQSGARIGGGGGGGGFAASGGNGGRGQSTSNGDTGAGGAGGGNCGSDTLIPLFAGSGGGSGGDGTGGVLGWPGGGGGGALQISSKVSLNVSGTIAANGGLGFSVIGLGGGGGGGSGGGVLLEAPLLNLGGSILVEGEDGAEGSAGDGGEGASAGSLSGENGTDETGSGQSGGGGGGGGGRVRIQASTAPVCAGVSPSASCTSGTMATP